MRLQCREVKNLLSAGLPPLFDCYQENGRVVIVTPFEYPDGDLMEFYLTEEAGHLVISDLAETLASLASLRFDVESTPKRRKLLEAIVQGAGVHYFQGELRVPVQSDQDLIPALTKLSQAALRAGDLLFTSRFGAGTTFKEEVEEFLTDTGLPHEQDYRVTGRSGQTYTPDFYIERTRPMLIEALSTVSAGYAEQLVNRTVRMWYDISRADGRFAYATVLDDSENVWKAQHFEVLASLSELVVWSEREQISKIARA